jgi:hypothetical protein
LCRDLAEIPDGTPQRYAFERQFSADVARAAGVWVGRVVIDDIVAVRNAGKTAEKTAF